MAHVTFLLRTDKYQGRRQYLVSTTIHKNKRTLISYVLPVGPLTVERMLYAVRYRTRATQNFSIVRLNI